MMCVHSYSGGVRVVYDKKGNKRHAKICYKCGHRKYIDQEKLLTNMIKVVNIKENKLNEITDKLGKEEILCQLSEECSELIQACLKHRRAMKGLTPKTEKETRDNLIEEMADVLLNIEQLISLLGEDTNREIDIIQAYKTDRWWKRTFFGQNTNCNSENP